MSDNITYLIDIMYYDTHNTEVYPYYTWFRVEYETIPTK